MTLLPFPSVISVNKSPTHQLSKVPCPSIRLIVDFGVEGDAHAGKTVKHRSRVANDPNQPNLRQVHLIARELFDEMVSSGFDLHPGQMGENITTQGVDLLRLSRGCRLMIGSEAVIEITGLRNPCHQLNGLLPNLMQALVYTDEQGNVIRKAGIMGIVVQAGIISPGDKILIHKPPGRHIPLDRV